MLLTAALLLLAGCSDAPPPVVGQVPTPAPAPQIEPDPTQLRIGVDDLGIGFNPHRIADLTPLSGATASLVLPSVFRTGPDGRPQLDTTVVTSATVIATTPFTVSYEIAPAATWSDNAPVAAEDFVYLWEQMRSQPGVVDGAGYRAVSDVRSRAGGKAVDVVFDRPYPAWPTLFDHLLPAHLLKDAPGAWGGALQDSIPVSGGPYAVRVVDRIRGQVTLARNDRYWGTPAASDQVVFQAAGHPSLIDRVRTGDVQATQFRADGQDLAALATAGAGFAVRPLPEAALVQLALRSDAGPLADRRVRRAVVAALDRDALIAAGAAGGPSARLRADAFATAPSEPGYRPTLTAASPARAPDASAVVEGLAAAGYTRDGSGRWEREGRPLTLRLAAPPEVSPFGRLLPLVVSQLDAAGIGSVVVAEGGVNPFPPGRGPIPDTPLPSTATPTTTTTTPAATTSPTGTGAGAGAGAGAGTGTGTGTGTGVTSSAATSSTATSSTATSPTTTTTVPPTPKSASDLAVADLTVLALPVGRDPVADLESVIGCPGRQAPRTSGTAPAAAPTSTPVPTTSAAPAVPGGVPAATPPSASTSRAPTSTAPTAAADPNAADGTSTDDTTAGTPLTEPQASEALSPTGFCDPALQSTLDAAASGSVSTDTALALVEPALWEAVPSVPLFQASSVLVAPADRRDVVVGPLGVSPFAGADRWAPPPRLARANGDAN